MSESDLEFRNVKQEGFVKVDALNGPSRQLLYDIDLGVSRLAH